MKRKATVPPISTHPTDAQHPGDSLPDMGEALRRARDTAPCPAYAWCAVTGDHRHHWSNGATLTLAGEDGPILAAALNHHHESDLHISLEGAELDTPEQARQAAAKFRQFADQLEAMAGQLAAEVTG